MKITGKWRWNDRILSWEKWDSNAKFWFKEHRPLPSWFVSAGAQISLERFIRIWSAAETLNTVYQELHWLDLNEIEALYEECNHILRQNHIQILKPLSLQESTVVFQKEEPETQSQTLQKLLKAGVLEVGMNQTTDDDGNYDSMKALLSAQKQRSEQGTIQFQSIEVPGRYRFTARH